MMYMIEKLNERCLAKYVSLKALIKCCIIIDKILWCLKKMKKIKVFEYNIIFMHGFLIFVYYILISKTYI